MQVFVKTLTGKNIAFEVQADTLILELKKLIYDREGIPGDQIRIVYGGKRLQDDQTISSYNIQNDSTLYITLPCLRGGFLVSAMTDSKVLPCKLSQPNQLHLAPLDSDFPHVHRLNMVQSNCSETVFDHLRRSSAEVVKSVIAESQRLSNGGRYATQISFPLDGTLEEYFRAHLFPFLLCFNDTTMICDPYTKSKSESPPFGDLRSFLIVEYSSNQNPSADDVDNDSTSYHSG
jgi:ubiquitin-large subunit ribosomal protein L40e